MTAASIMSCLRFDPSMEVPAQDDMQTAAELAATMHGICETTFK